jgi:hypothetical protein
MVIRVTYFGVRAVKFMAIADKESDEQWHHDHAQNDLGKHLAEQ